MSATAEGATGSFALGDDHRLIVEQVARLAEREVLDGA
jgi:hypothetical protein